MVRPGSRRWLDLALVLDAAPSMAMWQPLFAELRQTLIESGTFRNLTAWDLHPAGADGVTLVPHGHTPHRSRYAPGALVRPDGQQIVLLVSDCCGPVWETGAVDAALRRLGRHGPVAVVQPLPERLWARTAAPVTIGRLAAGPCAPNAQLRFTAFDAMPGPTPGALLLPVLEPHPVWFAGWASLVAAGAALEPAAVTYRPGPAVGAVPAAEPDGDDALELIRRFRAAASPPAVHLLRCLATTTPAVPIMRLVQREVPGRTDPGDLAEVVLSGLLASVPGTTGRYAFRPGIRDALLDELRRSDAADTVDVLTRLSGSIERNAGLAGPMFRALAPNDEAFGDAVAATGTGPFALVSSMALRRLYPASEWDGRAPVTIGERAAIRTPPDPRSVRTLDELVAALNMLRGTRSADDLARFRDLLDGRTAPTFQTLVAYLTACGVDEQAQVPWLAAWKRGVAGRRHRPAGAVRVREAQPTMLGVHRSIPVDPAVDDLPVYVPRDFDDALRAVVAAAAEEGGFVLLRGGSSAGKTRSLYEAVRAVLPDWWLVQPADAAAVRAFADAPAPRTVVWLDELQHYLYHPDGPPADAIRALVTAGAVVASTMWPQHAIAQELLGLARVIDVPETLSEAERRRALSLTTDPRILAALETTDAGMTQMLTAGPDLIRRWEDAADPYGGAVITAAFDARRAGVRAQTRLRVAEHWPWATDLVTAFARLAALPRPTT